ncbi:hypothetical protein MKJ04_20195 [Pontibacter sp. E15-1]|uniref:hypothetical protein n=1 Tax=Pontibacter sp. E15-1 TaxID=2919918 RepID=UPI001F4F24C8|nr:hypothetical protein [Pontibacter sp. E15-1]MCJ8167173.1 hypothetical protein [Pontibacter sp. E15-1]
MRLQEAPAKQHISKEELPKSIRKALKSDVLTVWEVSDVYRIADANDGKATYEVYFINAEHNRAIARYDEHGNSVTD